LFETGRNKTIVGVHRVVLPLRAGRLEARLLKRQFNLSMLLGVFGLPLVERIERSLDPERLKAFDHLGADGAIDAHTAKGNAAITAMIKISTAAVIASNITVGTAICDMQLAAAMTAAQQPGQQRLTSATEPRLMKLLPFALSLIRRWFLSKSVQLM
jgi:hypothetical protein